MSAQWYQTVGLQEQKQFEEYEQALKAAEAERLAELEAKWPGLKAWPGKFDSTQSHKGNTNEDAPNVRNSGIPSMGEHEGSL